MLATPTRRRPGASRAILATLMLLAAACGDATTSPAPSDPVPVPTPPSTGLLAGDWRLAAVDGRPAPTVVRVFLDEPVGDQVIARVEIRLDSAKATLDVDGRYQRRYYFTELHDGVARMRYGWGDHGRAQFVQDPGAARALKLTSEYIQNLEASGALADDGSLRLREPLFIQEAPESTTWVRR